MRPILALFLLLAASQPAHARFTPVVRADVAALAKRRARLYFARPCRHGDRWRVPGDSVVATHVPHVKRTADPTRVGCKGPKSTCAWPIRCLSKTRLDFSFRRRQSLARLGRDLARDAPRLARRYIALDRATKFNTSKRGEAIERYRKHLKFIQRHLERIARAKKIHLRRALAARGGWLKKHSERFIMQYVGERKPALTRLFADLSGVVRKLITYQITYPYTIYWKRQALEKLKVGGKYKGAPPALRGKLMAQDMGKRVSAIRKDERWQRTYWKEIRATLKRLKIRARWN